MHKDLRIALINTEKDQEGTIDIHFDNVSKPEFISDIITTQTRIPLMTSQNRYEHRIQQELVKNILLEIIKSGISVNVIVRDQTMFELNGTLEKDDKFILVKVDNAKYRINSNGSEIKKELNHIKTFKLYYIG